MTKAKKKILVSAYACEPDLGSEIGVGWHWVLEMAKYFDVWVLTRYSNKQSIESWFENHPQENVTHFIYYDLPRKWRFWKKGLRGVRLYYWLWQHLSNKVVRQTMKNNDIGIYHLLTYGNALGPASNFGQQHDFLWGPIGTGDTIPREYSRHYSFHSRVIEELRRLLVKTIPLNIGFRNRCRNANLILCKTENTRLSIPVKFRHKAITFTDVAVDILMKQKIESNLLLDDQFTRYLAVGRLDAWRGFDLVIEAFTIAYKKNKKIRLDILGDGRDFERLKSLVDKSNLDGMINLMGEVTLSEYQEKMATCDVVVNASLKEGAVTVCFDSMAYSKPLICVDTGGYTRYFNNEFAVVIPRTVRETLVSNLAAGIIFYTNKEKREIHGSIAALKSQKLGWEQKGKDIKRLISENF